VLGNLAEKIAKAVRAKDGNFNAVGRDNQVWDSCYPLVDKQVYMSGRARANSKL
jgi:hypothetical protein